MDGLRWGTPLLLLLAVGPTASALAAPFAFIANHGDDNVSVVDTATNHVTATIPVGHRPLGVALDPEGAHVYVSNQDGSHGSVSVIATAGNTVTPIDVGDDPTGVAVKLPGTRVYVANRVDKSVSVIDTATNAVITSVDVGNNPLGIAVNPAGTPLYVVNRGSNSVTVIDTESNEVLTTVGTGNNPTHVAVSPAGDRLYVTNNSGATVSVINAATLTVTGTVNVGSVPEGVVFNPDGTRAYVANSGSDSVSVIDTALETVLTTIPVSDQPEDVSITPDGARLYVLNRNDKTVSVIDTKTNTEIDADGDASNGLTRIPVGIGPVALSAALVPALKPPVLGKSALACQAAIAAQARAFAKADQGQKTACRSRLLKDVATGKGTQQGEAFCAANDLGNPSSKAARARSAAHGALMKKCGGLAPAAINRPCDRGAGTFPSAVTCILDQHAARVAEMVTDTFAAGEPKAFGKAALACQATITKAASQLAQSEQAQLGGCLVRILKDAATGKALALSAAACAKALDPNDPKAALPRLRASLAAKIAKKCVGVTPADIGSPCDSAAATIGEVIDCVVAGQARRAEKMVAAEFNDACPLLTAVGFGRAYPDVCSGR